VHTLRAVLEKLDHAKIKVNGLSLHKPTLDDVFLQLTGHATTQEESEESTKKGSKR
jgi:ABC-2 type transport system ATP-binding protein